MQLTLLKAKLHRVTVTHSELEYEGSCAIDEALLEASGILEYEQIHVYNVNTGARFVTYAIRAAKDSGVISVNGAAARLASPGDILIICAYAQMTLEQQGLHKPTLVYVGGENRVQRIGDTIPIQSG